MPQGAERLPRGARIFGAVIGERYAATRAPEQFHPEDLLEQPDLMADGRRRQVQLRRGQPKAAEARRGLKYRNSAEREC